MNKLGSFARNSVVGWLGKSAIPTESLENRNKLPLRVQVFLDFCDKVSHGKFIR